MTLSDLHCPADTETTGETAEDDEDAARNTAEIHVLDDPHTAGNQRR